MHAAGEWQDVCAAVVPGRAEAVCRQLRQDDEIAVEATGNTRLFYDAVVEQVARVVVVNPSQFMVISQSVKKGFV